MKLSDEVQAVHVDAEECCDEVRADVATQRRRAVAGGGMKVPELMLVAVAVPLRPDAAGRLHPEGRARVS